MKHNDKLSRTVDNVFVLLGCVLVLFSFVALAAAVIGLIWLAGQVL